jgi:hypothetical protein
MTLQLLHFHTKFPYKNLIFFFISAVFLLLYAAGIVLQRIDDFKNSKRQRSRTACNYFGSAWLKVLD